MTGPWRALVLAGDRGPQDPVARAAGVAHKAFAPVAGRAMIDHVLDALRAAPGMGEVAVALTPGAPDPGGVLRLDAAAGPSASVRAAFDRLGPPLLIATADHPLLTPAMLRAMLDAAAATGADALAGLCPRATAEAARPHGRRTWLRFSDGQMSGANLFALAAPPARGAIALWQRIEAERKRPARMARIIGPGLLMRYAAGRLDRAGAARALGRAAGCTAAFALIDHPDAAQDVDRPEDLAFAEARLAARGAGAG